MIQIRFGVFSERDRKPITRAVCTSRNEADRLLERVKLEDSDSKAVYWIAELGPECESWRQLVRELDAKNVAG